MRPDALIAKDQHYTQKLNRFINNNQNEQIAKQMNQEKAKSFHKTLRKPPKGVYLNYDELISLAESDDDQIFELLNRRLLFLRKEVQKNKQDISTLISKISNENDLKISLDVI
jgi:hypothetical protein